MTGLLGHSGRMRTSLAVAVALAGVLTACSSSSNNAGAPSPSATSASPTTAASGATGGTVHELHALAGNRWSTGTLTLAVGDSVKVTDTDPDVPHNFVVAGVGQSKTMSSGDVFTLRFPTAGTFQFVCTFHQSLGMEGTITVK
jgi:plastocyanin